MVPHLAKLPGPACHSPKVKINQKIAIANALSILLQTVFLFRKFWEAKNMLL